MKQIYLIVENVDIGPGYVQEPTTFVYIKEHSADLKLKELNSGVSDSYLNSLGASVYEKMILALNEE